MKFKKIIWAIDPVEDNLDHHQEIKEAINRVKEGENDTTLVLTYILESPFDDEIDDGPGFEKWENAAVTEAVEALKKRATTIGIPEFDPHVLVSKSRSVRIKTVKLIEFAARQRADLIVLGTHSRQGMERVALGSFAETLMLSSPIPLLIVNRSVDHKKLGKDAVYATDLDVSEVDTFKKRIEFFETSQQKVHLYHKLDNPLETLASGTASLFGGGWLPTSQHFESATAVKSDRIKELQQSISEALRGEAHLDTDLAPIEEGVVRYAKEKKASLILIQPQAGLIYSTLVGSTSRQIVRHSHCPVLIVPRKSNQFSQIESKIELGQLLQEHH